ncbi:MAG: phospholipase D-like domain-containing protein [Rickettsiales bacterium]
MLVSSTVISPPQAQARQSTQTAFSPSPQAVRLVQSTIGKAEKTIDVAAYSFTSHKIADALIRAHNSGVVVRMVLDKSHVKRRYPAVLSLQEAGIPTLTT